uniref:Uncharacterized protein n=1 Tax=Branchiostoma floridae TaxID=7739 RepID=C3ZFM8_BRAFL|eukprot:XP_002592625.1 hypothetical protein BRAFLDRAFT_104604 [Branchiostoma floridae]
MKKNGNGVTAVENGEGAQLLGSGSDSEVQEFALPPRKPGKVSRKSKKATVKVRDVEPSRGGCCSCQLVCHVFLYLLIIGAMGGLAWLTYNIKTEMDHLRNRLITNLATVDSKDTRLDVSFKGPGKRMKKRKELDALVSGKLTKKKREGHELLRSTGSDSSDLEEFSLPVRKSGFSKRQGKHVVMFA